MTVFTQILRNDWKSDEMDSSVGMVQEVLFYLYLWYWRIKCITHILGQAAYKVEVRMPRFAVLKQQPSREVVQKNLSSQPLKMLQISIPLLTIE